jgi:hypothetical protein
MAHSNQTERNTMNRCTSVTLIARALLFSVVVLLAGNGTSYAQQSDIDAIKAAIAAYHAVLGTLDVCYIPRLRHAGVG